jgi:hypothetical protein
MRFWALGCAAAATAFGLAACGSSTTTTPSSANSPAAPANTVTEIVKTVTEAAPTPPKPKAKPHRGAPAAPRVPSAQAPESHTVAGVVVFDGDSWTGPAGALCSTVGHAEAADVQSGAQVTLKNANGAVVGAGTLGTGQQVLSSGTTYSCGFHYAVSQIPKSNFYQFSLGSRAPVTYSYAQMQATGWTAQQTVS